MRLVLFTLLIGFILTGCSRTETIDTLNLNQLQQLSENTVIPASGSLNDMRYAMVRDTALSVGARSGLAWRSRQIDSILNQHRNELERAFNFNGLLLPHNVLPPVLAEGRDSLHLADTQTIRLAQRTYKIITQARFVTAAPNWREYISMDYQRPPVPDRSLLPKNPAEVRVWKYYIQQG
ncbi:MAG: type IV secretory system conjugative DNA transfer family protein [Legionellales bacterium]|nr:type IV secretory system conjugative DNA transfer family protein [Legionellales bacterium]